jgi:hypothetical protein
MAALSVASTPLPWRKKAPLHIKLGTRSLRAVYAASAVVPSPAAPATLNLRYDASTAIDRIIGFCLSVAPNNTAFQFLLQELNTGWFFAYTYGAANRGLFVKTNIETLPDEVSLSWSFSADPPAAIYMSFFNEEVVPVVIS